VLQVLRPRAVVDEDVVKEDQDEAAEERPEHVVHQCLEHGRRDCQAERHDEELEEALMRPERGLHYVVGVHKNLMIAGPQVELGEEARTAEFVPQLFHHRDQKLVLHRARDECPVIHAKSPRVIRFFTRSTGTENAEELGWITPLCNMATHCCSSSAFCAYA
jgi:hypothetical protein